MKQVQKEAKQAMQQLKGNKEKEESNILSKPKGRKEEISIDDSGSLDSDMKIAAYDKMAKEQAQKEE